MDVRGSDGRKWLVTWATATALASFLATLADAVLLQRRRGYFTGGFLSVDHLTSMGETVAFLAGSLFVDAAALGLLVAFVLWVTGRSGIDRRVASAVAVVAALVPVIVADFIEYRLSSFLGDAFDLALMFDLAGRSPREVWAVASAHVLSVAGMAAGALVVAVAVFWVLARRFAGRTGAGHRAVARVALRRALVVPCVLLIAGTVGATVLRTSSDVLDNGLRRKPTGWLLGAVVNTLSDVDGDGYGLVGRPPDSRLFDGRVHPYALDVPGNGVDEDGVAGDLPLAAISDGSSPEVAGAWQAKPDVVLIVLESFRADVLGANVGGRPVTPVLDALARRGVAVPHAYSHNGYTVQSRRHLFTGLVLDRPDAPTLVDDFKRNGYETAYFSGQDDSFGGPDAGVGLDRADVRYDARSDRERRYSTFTTAGSLAVPYNVLVERVSEFLRARQPGRPLFLYVNFHDTHFPYHHRAVKPLLDVPVLDQADIAPERAADLRNTYLNTSANVDRAVGEILDQVRASVGIDPGVIVVSDHGESLFDEGFLGHGYALNDAQTRIPLIVANLPLTVAEPFGQADLRGAIHAALSAPSTEVKTPGVRIDDSRAVFQYLGTIDRPAQIGFTTLGGRTLYDFRSDRVLLDGAWHRPRDLSAADRDRFDTLVRFWERLMVARAGTLP